MKIRTRLFATFFILAGISFVTLIDWIADDLRPRYLAAMEESMIDMATVLAAYIEHDLRGGTVQTDTLSAVFDAAQKKRFSARIYEMEKNKINAQIYVTNDKGIVLYDSDNGRDEGRDYSRWNDVRRTLKGEYGARATRSDPDDPMTATIHVAAPIQSDHRILGVVAVVKPTRSVAVFIQTARTKIAIAGLVAAAFVALLGVALSAWITWPIEKLIRYAKAVRDGKREGLPSIGRGEFRELGHAFEEMRVALEGKKYVEDYVQTLTHQMKSPLAAIRATAELLDEDMDPDQRNRFLKNLRNESARLHDIIDRMLALSALENRRELRDVQSLDLVELLDEVLESMKSSLSKKAIRLIREPLSPQQVTGERFLLRQALANLLQNAIDFCPQGGVISIALEVNGADVVLRILDNGPGIPEYALDKVFDRFYSLQRPDTGQKSSGLGLPFANEVALLHGGRIQLQNHPQGGAVAILTLPVSKVR